MRVLALTSDGEAAASIFTGPKWLIFETEVDGRRYCMHDGSWYRVDEGLNERVAERLAPVFARAAPIMELPEWPEEMEEKDYNKLLAEAVGGICLDRQLVQCETSPKGFESCDVFLPNGAYVHVKKVGKSQGASHLFAQAGVSTNILRDDFSARERFGEMVIAANGSLNWFSDRPKKVILVMGNKRVLEAQSLFSFSRVRLAHLATELKMQDVELSIVPIAYT